MTLTIHDFDEFFKQVNAGHAPFDWQRRLMRHVAESGRWPERISAPTGAGKSSVVDIHLFANALHASGTGARVPRRLSVVVNRRGLVDSHAQRAAKILAAMSTAEPDSVLASVAAALASLGVTAAEKQPFELAELRGGLAPDSTWLDDPSRCGVICATPDMWGSRLLLRGYGSSRYARPREAGMLAYDTVMVLDEAHLNRQLLLTSRRIGELAATTAHLLGVPALQTVETTATPANSSDGTTVIGVQPGDLDNEPELTRRLCTPKTLTFVACEDWPRSGKPSEKYLRVLAGQVQRLHKEFGPGVEDGRTVGCIVNRVDTAVQVATRLRDEGLNVELRVGRMRPYDLQRLVEAKPGLFTTDGDPTTDVLVATQTLEVGVDVDLAAMVTELAPGAALVQRAGRVNRLGRRDTSEVVVVGPPDDTAITDCPPYVAADLIDAYAWVTRRAATTADIAPITLADDPAPGERLPRTLLQRPELWDAWLWARTNDDLFDDPDLELWLRDDLGAERAMAGVVVRHALPGDSLVALSLLQEVPPVDLEVFPCTLGAAEALVQRVRKAEDEHAWVIVQRAGEVSVLSETDRIQPGDVLIVDDTHPVCTADVVVDDPTDTATAVPYDRLPGIRDVIVDDEMLTEYAGLEPAEAQELFEEQGGQGQLVLSPQVDDNGALGWIVVRNPDWFRADDENRQLWTRSDVPVSLESHSRDVAERAEKLGRAVGLRDEIIDVLHLAGQHHDDGKADPRFQKMLGRSVGNSTPMLAKSGARTAQQARLAFARSGLPRGWRHEQLSAVHAAHKLSIHPLKDLVVRLAGTSHGRGRPGFPHNATELLDPQELRGTELGAIAAVLFDAGQWDGLIERTNREWGVWGVAYLEALVRAADGQISREGR
ncbi:putative cRISPR-associated helicase Cas3, Anaes-subtype [Mycolicibacterium hassiacum DSM 44199]|uniref:Putative cRISPR-associated helicase Cas3, Anaes-subtype n=1 Tax=Mycolicibacterium hassiacum (strain DSM 44199 / CIP 105218 / JCM 12690 / 3849) TaxID=1122247 RepID=K5BHG2_MYCHD|nr:type I-U CRISPR-associated helicase/endonuclease Cas3 [Mycolicibacterium hassiacum]EKF24826.1 putative cRISPR-associated helicase Cas3, Anaes-subtype [Mycolicibacterium hassiacum DSM 44199]MDA4088293.1 CRISPR-associated protein Cas3 [Mycolicibacterium hassiacum DSM 44199]VCT88681.1 Putative CRISPR-associated nuclease/helicase Cas3 [Mycolicibacterium hassiacum DSM 44199]